MRTSILTVLVLLFCANIAFSEYSDVRHRRDQNGMHLSIPAKTQRGKSFPVTLNGGSREVVRVAFFTQGGYWNQHFPSYYKAEDIGVSVSELNAVHNYNSQFDYHRWELKGFSSNKNDFHAKINNSGRVLLYVWLKGVNGNTSIEQFIIDSF